MLDVGTVRSVAGRALDGLWDVDLGRVERAIGPRAYGRGRTYASRGRVLELVWDPEDGSLRASVVGEGAIYRTVAFFGDEEEEDGTPTFLEGECTCPVGYDCKHVAAVVVAAVTGGDRAATRAPKAHAHADAPERTPPQPKERPWERTLGALVRPGDVHAADGVPLAIEVTLQSAAGSRSTPTLHARLLRPAARDGWVNGGLHWNGMESWQAQRARYRRDHLALIRELTALHHARQRSGSYTSYGYGYGNLKTIELSGCSRQLWSLLDEAARIGLPLLHERRELGEVTHDVRGEVVLDVTRRGRADAEVRATLRVEAEAGDDGLLELRPLLFLGPDGHGVVCSQPSAHAGDEPRLFLVRLARNAPVELRRMVLGDERLFIPAADVERLAEDVCPALQRIATVVSSDGSFHPPEVGAPSLVLHARHGDGHSLELAWAWAYDVGGRTRQVPLTLAGAAPGFRDTAAERAALARVHFEGSGLRDLGLLDGLGRPFAGSTQRLHGLASMRFATDDLPDLHAVPGLTVRVEGEAPDYRDVGDTLEIGVSTTEVDGQRDWFGLGVTITVEGRALPFAEVFVALANGEEQMLLEDGAHFSLADPRLQALRLLIEEARSLVDSPSAALRISRYQAGLWDELVALGVVTEQARAWEQQVAGLRRLGELVEHEVPRTLLAELRPYQREGFAWLATLWELGLGGILADDMGLGKTLQALALICHARDRDADLGPFLVVAPTSVVPGWVGEADQFAPKLDVAAITDTLARSGRTIEDVAGAHVVVTTYTLLRLDAEAYGSVAWAGVILDEAQNVKNHQAKTHKCVRQLDSPFKLALTGTPMENTLMELWAILAITAPGLFPDPKQFSDLYARPIERRGDAERLATLRRRIKPLVKRRTKELVARDLPPKQEQTLEVELHPRHRAIYDKHLQRERQRVLGLLGDFDRNRFTILRSITILRQLSLHPGLVDDRHEAVPCAKLSVLTEQLDDIVASGHRALVFSQFTSFLKRVRAGLDQSGIGHCYLDGRTRNRDRVLEKFRNGTDPVFVISLKAGGVGLNLTEADYCFLLDPWWNPATENQAIDRTHRIGQTRPVMVYRTIARDTIEEKVVALAQRKAALFNGVMDEGDVFAGALTADDIHGLFE